MFRLWVIAQASNLPLGELHFWQLIDCVRLPMESIQELGQRLDAQVVRSRISTEAKVFFPFSENEEEVPVVHSSFWHERLEAMVYWEVHWDGKVVVQWKENKVEWMEGTPFDVSPYPTVLRPFFIQAFSVMADVMEYVRYFPSYVMRKQGSKVEFSFGAVDAPTLRIGLDTPMNVGTLANTLGRFRKEEGVKDGTPCLAGEGNGAGYSFVASEES